jgi:hypothetical protein
LIKTGKALVGKTSQSATKCNSTTAYTVRGKRRSDLCSWITQERLMKAKEKIKDSLVYILENYQLKEYRK